MCFNAPKTWQLGWFSNHHVSLDYSASPNWVGDLIGQADYASSSSKMMIIRITGMGASDYYVSFNRRSNHNSGTQEGANQVLVHKRDPGTGYKVSTLLAKLNAGGTYTITDNNGSATSL